MKGLDRCPSLALMSLIVAAALVLPTVALCQPPEWPEWVVYNTGNSGLPHDDGYNFAIDAQGYVWRGTEGGGAAKTDGMGDWTAYNTSNSGLPDNVALCIAFDGQGNTWIGTWSGGLAKLDGAGGWTVYNTSNSGLPGNSVVALAVDDQGNVWIAARNFGLTKFDGLEEWTVYDTANSGLPSMRIRASAFDDEGNLWMATQGGGVAKFDCAEEWTVYNTSNSGLPGDTFPGSDLAFDPDGNLWVGTESGAAKFDGVENWTVYSTSNSGLPNDVVYDFAFDDQGNVWMATQGGGVARSDGAEEWTVFDTSNSGLPYDFVTGVSIDAEGNLWIGTGTHHDGGASTGGVAVYREGGVIPRGLSAEFAGLTSATGTLGVAWVGQPTPLEVDLVFDGPLEVGRTLRLDLSPLGIPSDPPLEHLGGGRYAVRTTVLPPTSGHYQVPIVVETTQGERYRLRRLPLTVWPDDPEDLVILGDALSPRWGMSSRNLESLTLLQTDVVHAGSAAACAVEGKEGFRGWTVVFETADPVPHFDYETLRFALHAGSLAPTGSERFTVGVAPGRAVSLLEEGRIDLESREWQLVEIPLADFGTEEPIESVSFSGNFGGVFYVDDLVLGAIEPPPRSPTAVSGENLAPMPQAFALQRNYPNPFNSQTVIRFALPERRELDLGVYNVAGQRVATLASGWHPAGTHVMQWDGCDDGGRALASGVYLYRLVAGDRFRGTRCMLLLR